MNGADNTRIAKNTALMYLRMLIVMAINLWTVRLVLKALGVVDYGIYDVVAGLVTMVGSLSSVLSSATQRFYSFNLGKNATEELKKTFTASVNIFLLLAGLIIIIGEPLGIWLVNTRLSIPVERIRTANWLFQFSLLSIIFRMLENPFSGAVLSNEDMGVFAIISLLECIMRFFLALILIKTPFDRLFVYGMGLLVVSGISLFLYILIVHQKYPLFRYGKFRGLRNLYKEMISFSSWLLIGNLAGVSINQLCTIIVNIFFGPIVNAARAISFQVSNILSSFCSSFVTAIRPPMIKAYAQSEYYYLNTLFSLSNKFIYYSLLMISVPLFFGMDKLLSLWLNTNDSLSVFFSQLILIYVVLLSLNHPITYIIHATGHVKEYHLLVEIPTVLCAPITYLLFKIGMPAYVTYIVLIVAILASHILRLISLKKHYKQFDFKDYLTSFVLPAAMITAVLIVLTTLVNHLIGSTWIRIIAIIIISMTLIIVLGYLFGLSKNERLFVRRRVSSFINNKIRRIGRL